ncbi:MAG: o-succinylbenzoate synthase [Melioribacteraceae bacterium]
MIIKEAKYFPFTLKLKSPFTNASNDITKRSGLILQLEDQQGNISYGECSPLPGFSSETLEEAESSLNETVKFLNQSKAIKDFEIPSPLSSVKFAVEQALIDLVFKQKSGLLKNIPVLSNSQIKVNAVLGFDSTEKILQQIEKKIELGFDTFKIKVGRDNPYDDFELLELIRNTFGYDIILRLDANQKWSSDEAIEYLERFKDYVIEFVEEPCEFTCSTFRTIEESHIPIALDESIKDMLVEKKTITDCKAEFLVVKPMITGGIFSTIRLIESVKQMGKKTIISSSFESAVGKSALVMLASLTNHSFAHGLDTSELFENDLGQDPYVIKNSQISFNASEFPPKISLQN